MRLWGLTRSHAIKEQVDDRFHCGVEIGFVVVSGPAEHELGRHDCDRCHVGFGLDRAAVLSHTGHGDGRVRQRAPQRCGKLASGGSACGRNGGGRSRNREFPVLADPGPDSGEVPRECISEADQIAGEIEFGLCLERG
jgi:hypothetical protein